MSQENTPARRAGMDAPFRIPYSPGTPLFPLSPERVNGSRPPYGAIPLSPSLPEFIKPSEFELDPASPRKGAHSRNNSEALVQGMVARFDSLSLKDHQQMHRRDEVAIKRAEMAREMAELELKKTQEEREEWEGDAKKWREEYRKMKKEAEDGRERERKMLKRLEAQADEVERTARTHEHQRTMLDKDARRLRKEAYKTESALVKLQEELKAARNSLRVAQSGLEIERTKAVKREQEAFAAEYKLVGVQEALSKAQERMQVIEEERNALKQSLKEEEVARVAAEGRIALPISADGDDEFATPKTSPRKRAPTAELEDKENLAPARATELRALKEEVRLQSRLRQRAEEQIDFMKMECQFRCCSCRMAEHQGSHYVHDDSFDAEMDSIRQGRPRDQSALLTDGDAEAQPDTMADHAMVGADAKDMVDMPANVGEIRDGQPEENLRMDRPSSPAHESQHSPSVQVEDARTETLPVDDKSDHLAETMSSQRDSSGEQTHDMLPSSDPTTSSPSSKDEASDEDVDMLPEDPRMPHTPRFREVRTITTTTTIPLAFTPSSTPAQIGESTGPLTPATIAHLPSQGTKPLAQVFPASPGAALRPDGTLDREAALEQIRLRRGRARSMAMGLGTPKKQMIEGVGRRDISAPALHAR